MPLFGGLNHCAGENMVEFIIAEYKGVFAFLRRLARMVLLTAGFFLIAAVAVHFILTGIYHSEPEQLAMHREMLYTMMQSKDLIDDSGRISALALFFNNFIASGMSVALGAIPFLFLSAFTLGLNGALLGMVSAMISGEVPNIFYYLAVSIAPHGVFELPALFICGAMGMKLCLEVSARMLYRPRALPLFGLLGEMLRLMVLLVVPLLAAAAIVEAYLTPVLMQQLL